MERSKRAIPRFCPNWLFALVLAVSEECHNGKEKKGEHGQYQRKTLDWFGSASYLQLLFARHILAGQWTDRSH